MALARRVSIEQLVEEISQQDVMAALAELGGKNNITEMMTALGNYLANF